MSWLALIIREALWHRVNTAAGVVGVSLAVALYVVSVSIGRASERETRRVTRDLGYNLRIIPGSTEMDRFWRDGYASTTMPEAHVHELAAVKGLSYNHLIAFLQRPLRLGGGPPGGALAIVTGISSELSPPGAAKPSMIFRIGKGEVFLGHAIWTLLGLAKGDAIAIGDDTFRVAACLAERGSDDDGRAWLDLADAQRVLACEGRISEIQALDCLCLEPEGNPLDRIRSELSAILPDTRVVMKRAIAEARARQRSTAERRLAFVLPFALLVAASWIAALAILNVRARMAEIGVLRALGYSGTRIAGLFLGKALAVGLAGALLGGAVGSFVALRWGPTIFKVTANRIGLDLELLGATSIAAPLLTAVATLIPAAIAATRDPAETLRGDA